MQAFIYVSVFYPSSSSVRCHASHLHHAMILLPLHYASPPPPVAAAPTAKITTKHATINAPATPLTSTTLPLLAGNLPRIT